MKIKGVCLDNNNSFIVDTIETLGDAIEVTYINGGAQVLVHVEGCTEHKMRKHLDELWSFRWYDDEKTEELFEIFDRMIEEKSIVIQEA